MEGNGRQIHQEPREKVIIDTDPGIDDSVAIMMAFQAPSVQVLGLTTIFGNCTTLYATRNALSLCERAGHPEVPVAQGSAEPLKGGKPHVADFVHGSDGLGNISIPDPTIKKVEQSAAEFLVDKVSEFPGEVAVLALGPLTNVALAIKMDPSFASKVKRIAESSSTVAAHHMFVVVVDGVETAIHEGTLHGNLGKVAITSPGNLSADGLRSVHVRGGGGGSVVFTLCGDAAAEGVESASFVRCGAARVDGARAVSVSRCRAAEVEQAGRVSLERCREARLRGGGSLRAARCKRADVESFGEVHLARCKGARVDWCGSVEVELCRAVDVNRCGAVSGDRCRVVNAAGCGSVAVTHAVVNMLEEEQLQSQQPVSPQSSE